MLLTKSFSVAKIRSGGHVFLEKHGGYNSLRLAFFKMIDVWEQILIFEECRRIVLRFSLLIGF